MDRAVGTPVAGSDAKIRLVIAVGGIAMDDLSAIPALLAAGKTAAASVDWKHILGV
ncbi:MAG: hypothetical protein WDO73_06655 [Ignavibacteriota bacterium]